MADGIYKEGGITYKRVGDQIYKNDNLVDAASYKYIPTEIGGTRSTPGSGTLTPLTTQQQGAYQTAINSATDDATKDSIWQAAMNQALSGSQYGSMEGAGITPPAPAQPAASVQQPTPAVTPAVQTTYTPPEYLADAQASGAADAERYGNMQGSNANEFYNILAALQSQISNPATYNPQNDPSYNAMVDSVLKSVGEYANQRGILNSTVTRDNAAAGVANILPQLANSYYSRQQQQTQNMFDVLGQYSQQEQQAYERQQTAAQQQQLAQATIYQQQLAGEQQKIDDAWNRVKSLGYVDNQASQVLGIPVGTLTYEAQKAYDEINAKLEIAYQENETKLKQLDETIRHNSANEEIDYAKAKLEEIKVRLDRSEVVTNADDAAFLGVEVGTPTWEAKKKAIDMQYDYDKLAAEIKRNNELTAIGWTNAGIAQQNANTAALRAKQTVSPGANLNAKALSWANQQVNNDEYYKDLSTEERQAKIEEWAQYYLDYIVETDSGGGDVNSMIEMAKQNGYTDDEIREALEEDGYDPSDYGY